MTWTALTFNFGSTLTSTQMTQLFNNTAAFAAKDSGAPTLAASYITETMIGASTVSQGKLKTTATAGSVVVLAGLSNSYPLTGGSYSWWTSSSDAVPGTTQIIIWGGGDTAAGVIGLANQDSSNSHTFYLDERYVQASPPYNLGPLFIFLLVNPDGSFAGIRVMPDPPWAYHGPTDITPQYWRNGKSYRRVPCVDGVALAKALRNQQVLRKFLNNDLLIEDVETEITLAYKDSDMAVMPHPFDQKWMRPGQGVILLEPGSSLMGKLSDLLEADHARTVRNLIEQNYLDIDFTSSLNVSGAPPGVQIARARMRLS